MFSSTLSLFMRKHADWLTQADERILEFLREEGNHPPTAITRRMIEAGIDIEYHPNHVGTRCRELAKYGLLVNVGAGTYSITEKGVEFLDGDLDVGSLEKEE